MHDNTLTQDNRDKFIYIAGHYGQIIKFYNVEKICADEIATFQNFFGKYPNLGRVTIGSIYKLIIPQAISNEIEKVIYLDSDLILNFDINELWQIPIGDKPLAAVAELNNIVKEAFFLLCKRGIVNPEDYFNSGVMIMNLKQLRHKEKETLWKGIKFLAENPEYPFFEQEILNYSFSNNYSKLTKKFNGKSINGMCHFINKTLNTDMSNIFNRLWFRYFAKTPWFNEDVIEHLNEGYRKIINQKDAELKNFSVQVSAVMSGKSRVFFTAAQNIEVLKKIFLVRDDEEIIPIVNQESFQTLVKSMFESRGKKVFFILFEQYNKLRDDLKKIGFVENQDFIDATKFLSDANGVPLNTYDLVKAM